MTDLDKFKEFFDSLRIKYDIEEGRKTTELDIDRRHIYQSYNNQVRMVFDSEGSFIEFQGWGE